jgi:hypothetical protein
MPRERTGDYSRVDEALEDIKEDVEFEYGDKYENLDASDQKQVLLDHFFRGLPQYEKSADDMRRGLKYSKETGEGHVSVDTITRRGHEYRVIRDAKSGRIRQWVREG